jgi:hypothetical protein
VQLRPDQCIEESERVAIINDLVFVRDDPQDLAGVLPEGFEALCRDQFGCVLGAEVICPLRRLDHEDVAVRDLPAKTGLVERLVDRFRILVEHDAQRMPGNLAHGEHLVVGGDALSRL